MPMGSLKSITYSTSDAGEERFGPVEVPHWQDAHGSAEECAEHYHDNHDGWESVWPLDVTLYDGDENLGTFVVEMEAEPIFTASEKVKPSRALDGETQ